MTPAAAISFLEEHQPMPADSELTEDLIGEYDAARRAVEGSHDPRVASLILNSTGDGDGWGVYQLLDDTLRTLPRDRVIEALTASLRSPYRSVRSWSMELALEYSDPRLVPMAIELLGASDRDERVFAAYFIADLHATEPGMLIAMGEALATEQDEEVASVIRDRLGGEEPSDRSL